MNGDTFRYGFRNLQEKTTKGENVRFDLETRVIHIL